MSEQWNHSRGKFKVLYNGCNYVLLNEENIELASIPTKRVAEKIEICNVYMFSAAGLMLDAIIGIGEYLDHTAHCDWVLGGNVCTCQVAAVRKNIQKALAAAKVDLHNIPNL